MSEYNNFNPYGSLDLDPFHGVEEGMVSSNHPTPVATGSNPHTPQHTEHFEGVLSGTYPNLGIDMPHWETLQSVQNQYQQHQEYHSHHTSPMASAAPTPNAFHTIPMPQDALLDPPLHTVPSHHDHSTTNPSTYGQYQQGQTSPTVDNAPILLLHPNLAGPQAPRHRVASSELSRPPSTTPTSSSILMQQDRSSPVPVASGSRSKTNENSSTQGGVVRNTRSTRARSQLAGAAAPYHPRPVPAAPAGRLGGMMGSTQPSTTTTTRHTRQSAMRFAGAIPTSVERKVSGESSGLPSPIEIRMSGSPHAPSPQHSPPLHTPPVLLAVPSPPKDMGGGMFTFHSKNRVTASSTAPAPFPVASQSPAQSSKGKSKAASRPPPSRPPPVVTEFVDAEDRLPSIPEGTENNSQPSTSRPADQESHPRQRRFATSDEAFASKKVPRHHPYMAALQRLKLKAFRTSDVPSYAPRTDIHYDFETYTMIASMEMPGVKRDDIEITLGTSEYNHIKFVHVIAESHSVFDRVVSGLLGETDPAEELAALGGKMDRESPAPAAQSAAVERLRTIMAFVHAGLISPDVRERKFGILKRAFPVPDFTKLDDLDAFLQDGVLTLKMFCGKPKKVDDVQVVPVRC